MLSVDSLVLSKDDSYNSHFWLLYFLIKQISIFSFEVYLFVSFKGSRYSFLFLLTSFFFVT